MLLRSKYGEAYTHPRAYALRPGCGGYAHRFGGTAWNAADKSLLVTLDLSDPKLKDIGACGLSELPLCSHLRPGGWDGRQEYVIDPQKKSIIVLDTSSAGLDAISDDYGLPNPLPFLPLQLKDLLPDEYPLDEDHYWKCCDQFLGGETCLRVLGQPLWLDSPEWPKAASGDTPSFVMGVGYEAWNGPYQYLGDRPLFIGEGALYFFFSASSLTMTVISQSS